MQTIKAGVEVLAPDFITFQEVSPQNGRPQIEGMAIDLDYRMYYADAGAFRGRREGNAILSKRSAVQVETLNLSDPDVDLQRVALCCFFDGSSGGRFAILSTHLAYPIDADAARSNQAAELVSFIEASGARAAFALGADLNAVPSSEAVGKLLTLEGAKDAWDLVPPGGPKFTFSADNPLVEERLWPDRRIDYIIAGGQLKIESCEAVFTKANHGIASDHYGVLAEIVEL